MANSPLLHHIHSTQEREIHRPLHTLNFPTLHPEICLSLPSPLKPSDHGNPHSPSQSHDDVHPVPIITKPQFLAEAALPFPMHLIPWLLCTVCIVNKTIINTPSLHDRLPRFASMGISGQTSARAHVLRPVRSLSQPPAVQMSCLSQNLMSRLWLLRCTPQRHHKRKHGVARRLQT